MQFEITFDDVLRTFPDIDARYFIHELATDKITKAKQAMLDIGIQNWKWTINFSLKLTVQTADHLAHVMNRSQEEADNEWRLSKNKTVQERVDDYVGKLDGLCFVAKYRRAVRRYPSFSKDKLRGMIGVIIRPEMEKQYKEDQRLLGLTPAELKIERDIILKAIAEQNDGSAILISRK